MSRQYYDYSNYSKDDEVVTDQERFEATLVETETLSYNPKLVRDMIFVNQFEFRLGRQFSRQEVLSEEFDGEVEIYVPQSRRFEVSELLAQYGYKVPDSGRVFVRIDRLPFPRGLLSVEDKITLKFGYKEAEASGIKRSNTAYSRLSFEDRLEYDQKLGVGATQKY